MDNCLFCKIVRGEIPSAKVYEDERCYAFKDINPQSKTHILIVPREHMKNALECAERGGEAMKYLTLAAAKIAREQGIAESGFRLVVNCGEDGRQSVQHLHMHLLGGETLTEKMA